MPQSPVIGARGIYDNPSQFANMPQGALVTASNVYIDRDLLVTSRRGFNILSSSGLKSYKFFYFKDTFMSVSSVFLKYSGGAWTANSFSAYNPGSSVYPMIMGVSNNNAYIPYSVSPLTNSDITFPVFKLEDPDAVYNTAPKPGLKLWQQAGLPEPMNVYWSLLAAVSTPTWLANNRAVAYRAAIGYRDSNNNLIIGGVSGRKVVLNASGGAAYPILGIEIPGDGGTGLISGATYSNNFPLIAGYHKVFLFRSPIVAISAVPSDNMKLVYEAFVSAADMAANQVTVTDLIAEGLEGVDLYTNADQEGILANNSKIPNAKCIAPYKSMMMYSNYRTQHIADIQLLAIGGTIGLDTTCKLRFFFEATPSITWNNADLFIDYAAANNFAIQEVAVPGSSTAANIELCMTDTCDAINCYNFSGALHAKYISDLTSLPGQVRLYADYPFYVLGLNALTCTAFGFAPQPFIKIVLGAGTVSTVNGNFTSAAHGFSTGDIICVLWDEPTNPVGTAPTGLTVSTVVYYAIRVDANNFRLATSINNAYAGTQVIPSAVGSGTLSFARPLVASGNNYFPNLVAPSKDNKPEEVPLAYALPVGSANFEILNTIQLRDTFFIFKEDGLWIMTGDTYKDLRVQQLDPTCILVAIDSVAILNNAIFALSRKGVVKITENGVDIVSDMIRTPIQSIVTSIGSNYDLKISGTAYESENKYYLSVPSSVNSTYGGKTWVYNTLTNTWTTVDKYFTAGLVNINENKMFFGRDENAKIYAERKTGDYTDFCDEDLAVTINSVSSNSVVLASASGVSVGDVLYQSSSIWAFITAISSNTLTVYGTPGFTAGSRTVKKKFDQEVEYFPIHNGAPGVLKNFRDVTFHQQNPQYYKIQYLFRSDYSGSEEGSTVSSDTWMNGSFGFGPFGGTPWGGINAEYNESPRIMMPRNKARATYIVPIVKLQYAFSEMNLAGLSLNYEGVSERTRR